MALSDRYFFCGAAGGEEFVYQSQTSGLEGSSMEGDFSFVDISPPRLPRPPFAVEVSKVLHLLFSAARLCSCPRCLFLSCFCHSWLYGIVPMLIAVT